MPQTLPRRAEAYSREQRREIAAAVAAVGRQWSRMGDEFDRSFTAIELPLLETVYVAQGRVAEGAQAFIPGVMAEVGMSVRDREYETFPQAYVGTAGDGRDVPGLLRHSVVEAKSAVAAGASPPQALSQAGAFLSTAVGTLLSDTARSVEQVEAKSRKVGTFVRMLTPPSCGRCVMLAGQRYGSSQAFLRHPGCDCRHIPAPESVADDFTVDPSEYLDGLDDAQLAKTLGSKANAQAYKDGADIPQLVNAYRRGGDVRTAQVYGRNVRYTTEGTTRRGWAYHRMAQADYIRAQGVTRVGTRYQRLKAPRLMPESIYKIATDRADAQRLLKLYGWVV